MRAILAAYARDKANGFARAAGECQATGAGIRPWHKGRIGAVLDYLAAAESAAPEAERPWHAARLDAWVAAYGLTGWRRFTNERGHHEVFVGRVRAYTEEVTP